MAKALKGTTDHLIDEAARRLEFCDSRRQALPDAKVRRLPRHLVARPEQAGGDAANGPMYGHGFATLFLGEVYGMTSGGGDTNQAQRLHEAVEDESFDQRDAVVADEELVDREHRPGCRRVGCLS